MAKAAASLATNGAESTAIDKELRHMPEEAQRRWMAKNTDRSKWALKNFREFLEQEQRDELHFRPMDVKKKSTEPVGEVKSDKKVHDKPSGSFKKGDGRPFTCIACGEEGHALKACPNPDKKNEFYKRAASGDKDTLRKMGIPGEFLGLTVPTQERGLYLPGTLNGQHADLLVDTGAVAVEGLIAEHLVEQLGLKPTSPPNRQALWLSTATGHQLRADRVVNIDLELGQGMSFPVCAYVTPTLPVDVVLGLPWLSKVHAKIDAQAHTVDINGKVVNATLMRYGSAGPPPVVQSSEKF